MNESSWRKLGKPALRQNANLVLCVRPAHAKKQHADSASSTPDETPLSKLGRADLISDFAAFLPLPAKLEPHLEQALRHVLDHPGSMVRPQLVLQMALAYDLPEAAAKGLAIALEYFHTASLIFDDLPCMDHASMRRGAPCVHRVHGEAGAILSALAFINRAYALAWRAVSLCPSSFQQSGLDYLEEHLGIGGLLNGQSLDLHYATLPHNGGTVERIAIDKTVSLVRLALVLPALLGGAPEEELQLLDQIAMCWGLSYQILDDLKDVFDSDAEAGKTVARDASLDRPNLALSIGIPGAVQQLSSLLAEGDELLRRLFVAKSGTAFLEKLCGDLKEESARVTESACEMTLRGLA